MDQKLLREYRSLRLKHPTLPALTIYRWATSSIVEPKYRAGETYEIDGFEVSIEVEPEQSPDISQLDHYGEYTDTWEQGAIDLWARKYGNTLNQWHGPLARRLHSLKLGASIPPSFFQDPLAFIRRPDGKRYLVPQYSYEQHRKDLIGMKFGKSEADRLAREYVKKDLDRLEDACSDYPSFTMVGIMVEVKREGLVLGRASVWGFESDDDTMDSAIEDHGLIDEALEEAKATVERLCVGAST